MGVADTPSDEAPWTPPADNYPGPDRLPNCRLASTMEIDQADCAAGWGMIILNDIAGATPDCVQMHCGQFTLGWRERGGGGLCAFSDWKEDEPVDRKGRRG